MILRPLTVAATVLSGEFELDEHAEPKATIRLISAERVKNFEDLCTWFCSLQTVEQAASLFRLYVAEEQAGSRFYLVMQL